MAEEPVPGEDEGEPGRNRFAAIEGMDPRAAWLLGPGQGDFLPLGEDSLIPAIFLTNEVFARGDETRLSWRIPLALPSKVAPRDAERAFLAFAPLRYFEQLALDGTPGERDAIEAIVLGSPIDPAALPDWQPGDPPPSAAADPDIEPVEWPEGTVVIGVIDDGIAFANRRFRLPDGSSRVQSFWMQGIGPKSPTVDTGRELLKADIDQLLVDWRIDGRVDEPALYAASGLVDFATPGHKGAGWRAAHGTHVLDFAATLEPGADPRTRPIIAVELPTHAVADTSFKLLEPLVIKAIDHIIDRAARLAPAEAPLPLVICFSYGMFAGSHDGTHPVERLIDQYVGGKQGRLAVVLPAGNNHLGRHHAELRFTEIGEVRVLPWRVQPDDRNSSSVEIWLPYQPPPFASRLQLAVEPPPGQRPPNTPLVWLDEQPGATEPVVVAGGEEVGLVSYKFVGAATERGTFRVDLDPTMRLAPLGPKERVAPAGLWRLHLRNVGLAAAAPVRLWIQRNDAPYGYPIRGRQSYFDDPSYRRFTAEGRPLEEDWEPDQVALGDSPVKRRALVNAIATGEKVIVAGGFERRERRLTCYSAGGPITGMAGSEPDPDLRKPDALIATDDSRVQRGILAAGTATGSIVAFTGTSVAAPQLARLLATWLAEGDPADRDAVKNHALPPNGQAPGNEREGWGMIDTPPVVPLKR